MFAFEIAFADGVSQPETILVRRPNALVGAADYAHVVIDDMRDLPFQIRVVRELGRNFRISVLSTSGESADLPTGIEGVYSDSVILPLGKVRLGIVALDTDLIVREQEAPDRAGVRVLRQSTTSSSSLFPAMVVAGSPATVVSFSPDQPVYVGRSKACAVRVDSADVSSRHARCGFEGGNFWIEDLGSTNGTFIGSAQVSGRQVVAPGTPIVVGREVTIIGVVDEEQLLAASNAESLAVRSVDTERRYPILLCPSELARPQRLALVSGVTMTIGRDPTCDLWLGVPHVSRKHCTVRLERDGSVVIEDSSTNGTGHSGGILRKGESLVADGVRTKLDFSNGLKVFLCFSENDEQIASEAPDVQQNGQSLDDTGENKLDGKLGALRKVGRRGTGILKEGGARSLKQVARSVSDLFQNGSRSTRILFIISVVVFLIVFAIVVSTVLPLVFGGAAR